MCPHRPVCTVHQQRQLLPGVPRQRHHRGGAGLRHRELGEGPLRRPSFLPGVLWGAGIRFPWLSSAAVTAGPLVGPPAERVLEEGRRPHFLDEVLRLPPGLEQPLLGPGKPGARAMLTGACLSDSSLASSASRPAAAPCSLAACSHRSLVYPSRELRT